MEFGYKNGKTNVMGVDVQLGIFNEWEKCDTQVAK